MATATTPIRRSGPTPRDLRRGDVDEDCDGLADDADDSVSTEAMLAVWADTDGDGFGDAAAESTRCDLATGWVADATDCDDTSGQ